MLVRNSKVVLLGRLAKLALFIAELSRNDIG
jgi:hypothetical protein